ncbi:hypothetical protein [uncultured Tessaracoccus sp.]|uniref:hypothetical protein n=1 Tax=uncultured Tessaracoccus sp. TaxID=905023 RepID=UPI00262467CB|nr:hypothetical protein [uncultured Tessaracoccus sp.]
MAPAERVVSGAARRARQMMIGGVVGGHAAGLIVIALAAVVSGYDGVLTSSLGFATVVIFYGVGQWLEAIASDMEPMHGLGLVLASYAVRVVGIAAGLWAILSLDAVAPRIIDGWLVASMTATVFAWVGGVVLVASRQRVPIYDEIAPADPEDEQT